MLRYTPAMRSILVVTTGLMLLGAQRPSTSTIALNRVEVGQPEIFVAASDGSGEHPLLSNPDRDYDESGRRMAGRSCSPRSEMDRQIFFW
jgi:hypothetical protein